MTSIWSLVAMGLALAGVGQLGKTPSENVKVAAATPQPAPRLAAPPSAPQAPAYLRDRLRELGRSFDGEVGIAVKSVDEGWAAGWRADELYPQQSVSKIWVAIAALDAVDRGRVDLSQRVTLTRNDLTVFWQPIASKVLSNGGHTISLGELLTEALTRSDNTANDKLMRSIGGAEAVRRTIAEKGLGQIRFYNGERLLQSRIAGLSWSQSYSVGRAFYTAREAVPLAKRRAAFQRYLDDPYDGASAAAIVDALARLKRGELLSPASTARLLATMGNTQTGPNRLRGGLKPGWTIGHKTGTGQVLGGAQAGYNDIGILTGPDGTSYAVAVMIRKTSAPLPVRMRLMNEVVRATILQHEMTRAPAYTL